MTTIKDLKRRLNLTLALRTQIPTDGPDSYQAWLHYHLLANKYQNRIDTLNKVYDSAGLS